MNVPEEDVVKTTLIQICRLDWWKPRFCRLFKLIYEIECNSFCGSCISEKVDQIFYIYEDKV